MKQLIFVLGTLLWPLLMEAQSASLALPMPQTSLKAAYLGSFVYPGFKLGLERPYKVIQFQKNKKSCYIALIVAEILFIIQRL